jgi:hypothetical protein
MLFELVYHVFVVEICVELEDQGGQENELVVIGELEGG